ncbi:hypothetical protein EKL32_22620 [Flavobacterium sp. GSN2]|nr:hypothetical protein EKL32_22620 [Flavobacterium sp. GSN2]
MAYRNGTYVAFAADGATNILTSDIKYYRLLQGWKLMKGKDFNIIDSHEKGSILRKGSLDETIKRTLRGRLDNSTRLLLLVGNTTRFDDDFVPYEIRYAIDTCKLPVIVCYVNYDKRISNNIPQNLLNLLPKSLKDRMDNGTAKTIHIPFRERILNRAIQDYHHNNLPSYSSSIYQDHLYNNIYTDGKL